MREDGERGPKAAEPAKRPDTGRAGESEPGGENGQEEAVGGEVRRTGEARRQVATQLG